MYNRFKGDNMVDIKFHCDIDGNFSNGLLARAFTYKDYSIEMHNHVFYEVNIVLSGSGIHCIEEGRFLVKAGDVFVIPPMVAHAYTETRGLEVYHILLQKSFLEQNREETAKVTGFLQLTEIEPFLRSNSISSFFLHLSYQNLIRFQNDIALIDDSGDFSLEDFRLMKYHAVWKILYWFSALLTEQLENMGSKPAHKYEIQIIKALEYMHGNFSEKITIEGLCKKLFMSRSTFLRSFYAVCGTAPIEYLNNYRCKKALEMLNTESMSKTEVAHSCGFYDLSHMERMLKNKG